MYFLTVYFSSRGGDVLKPFFQPHFSYISEEGGVTGNSLLNMFYSTLMSFLLFLQLFFSLLYFIIFYPFPYVSEYDKGGGGRSNTPSLMWANMVVKPVA